MGLSPKRYNKKAFTLIELIVVIAIVGIISAAAIPVYKSYDTKVKIFKVFTMGRDLADYMMKNYIVSGAFPTTYVYGGATRAINQWYNVNDSYVSWINVAVNTNSSGEKSVVAQLSPSVSLWQAMNGTTAGQNLFIWSWEDNGLINTVCTDGHQSNSIPEEFLPTGCLIMSGSPVP